ncbi:IS630 family transposase [Rhizophagus clarus]|uniref:IS630 family transposase n=1 Tax=Rhizophagus clarus TaxID=94130 RepID=A0A8H3LCV4_9GLOM|nr:IS630 family transposase [Rhizophagus clarus]
MNAYPSEYSVLVLDNVRIHHDKDLIEYIESFSERVEFLPPYSPDFNPIESSFSVIKSFLQKYRDFVNSCSDPRYPLLIACIQITLNMTAKFFKDSIYM